MQGEIEHRNKHHSQRESGPDGGSWGVGARVGEGVGCTGDQSVKVGTHGTRL